MAARQNYYDEYEAEESNSGSTWADTSCALTFTPDANATYLLLASWEQQPGSAGNSETRFYHDTASTPHGEYVWRYEDGAEYRGMFGAQIYTAPGSPASQTWRIQFKESTNVRRQRIIAIKLESTDEHNSTATDDAETGTTFVDALAETFTPASQGDYLIVAWAQVEESSQNAGAKVRLVVDGGAIGEVELDNTINNANMPYWCVRKVNLAASSKTIKLQHAVRNSGTCTLKEQVIVALRLDEFADNYSANQDTEQTTTSTTYDQALRLSATPANELHLQIYSAHYGNTHDRRTSVRLDYDDGTDQNEQTAEVVATAYSWARFCGGGFRRVTPTAAAHTWDIDFATEINRTASVDDMTIALVELNEAAGGPTNYEGAVSEGADAAATLTVLLAGGVSLSEGSSTSDQAGPMAAFDSARAEAISAGEALSVAAAVIAGVTEATTAQASLAVAAAAVAALSEGGTVAAAALAAMAVSEALTEAASASAAESSGFGFGEAVSESAQAGSAPGIEFGAQPTRTEQGVATDQQAGSLAGAPAKTEPVTATDAPGVALAFDGGLIDSVAAAAVEAALAGMPASASAGITASAAQTIAAALAAAASEPVNASAAQVAAAALAAALAEALGASATQSGAAGTPGGGIGVELVQLTSEIERALSKTSAVERRKALEATIQRVLQLRSER